jgi:hypothetical protein
MSFFGDSAGQGPSENSRDQHIGAAIPFSVRNILALFECTVMWTRHQALSAHTHLNKFKTECSRNMHTKESKNSILQVLCERSLEYLRAVTSRHGSLAVVPMFAFLEEVCSTHWGVVGETSTSIRAKMDLRCEFCRTLRCIKPDSELITCLSDVCSQRELRDILHQRASVVLSGDKKWFEDHIFCDFCFAVAMIRVFSDPCNSKLISSAQQHTYRGDILKDIEFIRVWSSSVVSDVVQMASFNFSRTSSFPKDFMLDLLKAISQKGILDTMKSHGISEFPAFFLDKFLSKLLPYRNDQETILFGQFLVVVCEHLSCSDDLYVDNPFLEMFIRPLCDLHCQDILMKKTSGIILDSSAKGRDGSVSKCHTEVFKELLCVYLYLNEKSVSDDVKPAATKISELWESAVLKLFQGSLQVFAQFDETGDPSAFQVSNFSESASQTAIISFSLKAGVRNLFVSEKSDDYGEITRLGATWVRNFDLHVSGFELLKTSGAEYVQTQSINSVSISDQSSAFCLRPFCDILNEILSQCSQLCCHNTAHNVEKVKSTVTLLLAQLFLALASSKGMCDLVTSFTPSYRHAPQILILLRRIFKKNAFFHGYMIENGLAIPGDPANSVLGRILVIAEAAVCQRVERWKASFESSLYYQVCQTWAGVIFDDTLSLTRGSIPPPSIVCSMCDSLFATSLQHQLSYLSCCASEFSHVVLNEASKVLVPPHRFAAAAKFASNSALIGFLTMCSTLTSSEKSVLSGSQLKVIESVQAFTGNIFNMYFQIADDQITEPELKCLEAPPGLVSSVDMADFIKLPQMLFPDADFEIQHSVITSLRRRFDTWREDNVISHQIFNFLSHFFGKSSIPVEIQPVPEKPSSIIDQKMLKELLSLHRQFVRHVNSLRRHSPGSRAQDVQQLHSQLKHFCDCNLFLRQFHTELQKYPKPHDASICASVSEDVLTYIETLFIQPDTTFEQVIGLVYAGSGALFQNSRIIEKEVSIIESWFENAGSRDARVDMERVRSALKILQYRNNVGEASGALKNLHVISYQAIKSMDEALGVSVDAQGLTLYDRLHDDSISLADTPRLLLEIERVFHNMDPSALDIIVHVERAKAAWHFLRKQDVVGKSFFVLWTNAESRAMGNPFITSVLDKLLACRHFLQPIYRNEMDMTRLAAHLSKFHDASKHRELIDQLNTVAQQWSNVEWYFYSGDNQATLALLGHFQASGRFQSMGRNCLDGPAIRFCFRISQTATQEQYDTRSLLLLYET